MLKPIQQYKIDDFILYKETIIDKLNWIINNWEEIQKSLCVEDLLADFQNRFGQSLQIDAGLCVNADLSVLSTSLKLVMFNTFSKTCGSIAYPLDEFENYIHMRNFTETPERLELAKHCIEFIENERWKEHFVVEDI